jgi:multiple sugar transport system substrate-binding protein
MHKLKLLGAAAVALTVGGLAAGASYGGSVGPASPQASAVTGNIVLAHWASSPVETQLLQQVINDFEKRFPGIKVRRRALGQYDQQMLAAFAARKPPDVFYVDSNVAPDWIKQGVLQPLDSFINRFNFRTKPFFPRLLNAFKGPDGRTYGFPKDWSPLGMQVNQAILTRTGTAVPTTWATLQTTARRMSAAIPGGKPICIAADWARLLAFVYQNEGSFLSADKKRATVNTKAVLGAVDFYVNLLRDGLAGTPAQLGVGWCGEALGKEKAAIVFEGNWVIPYMAETFPNVRYATYPMIKNKAKGNLAFTVSYSIAKDSKNKPAAWTLLTYLTGRTGMKTWTSKGLALPSRNDVKPVAGRRALINEAPHARPWQFAPGFSRVMTIAGNELTAVFEGKQDTPTMLKKIQDVATQTLRRGGR